MTAPGDPGWSRRIDWSRLAEEIGLRAEEDRHGGQRVLMGSDVARRALEAILGEANLRRAVDQALDGTDFAALSVAQSVLVDIRSGRATEIAYERYREAEGRDDAGAAVMLIAYIGHREALRWVPEFLADRRVWAAGVGVLEQVLSTYRGTDGDPRVPGLLALAETHVDDHVRTVAERIRRTLSARPGEPPGEPA